MMAERVCNHFGSWSVDQILVLNYLQYYHICSINTTSIITVINIMVIVTTGML